MFRRILVPIAVVGLFSSVPLLGEEGPKEAKSEPEKKICKTEKVTGSLARKRRICMTQDEWDELAANTKKGMDDYGRGAAGAPKCIGLNCDRAPGM